MKRTWTPEQLREAVKSSKSLTEVAVLLGLSPRGGNYKTIGTYIARMGLPTGHFEALHQRMDRVRKASRVKLSHTMETAQAILFQPRTRFTHATRRFAEVLLDATHCALCYQGLVWNSKPLVLQIDHIDGDIWNNRVENLRFICANCHTQTDTFSTRSRKRHQPSGGERATP